MRAIHAAGTFCDHGEVTSPSSSTPAPTPGWYRDPGGPGLRWWDGHRWGQQRAPLPPGEPQPERPLADQATRLVARIIDGLLTAVVIIPLLLGLFYLALADVFAAGPVSASRADEMIAVRLPLVFVAWLVLGYGLQLAYESIMLSRSGQTIGKKVMKIRVVRLADNHPPSAGQAALRTLAYLVLSGIYIDALWCLWDKPWRQCLHDKVVSTIVVRA